MKAKPKTIDAYRHSSQNAGEQQPDTQLGDYFVSVFDNGRHVLVAGPYVNDHAGALADVSKMRAIAERHDPRAVWYAFGTVRLAPKSGKVGMLNKWNLC